MVKTTKKIIIISIVILLIASCSTENYFNNFIKKNFPDNSYNKCDSAGFVHGKIIRLDSVFADANICMINVNHGVLESPYSIYNAKTGKLTDKFHFVYTQQIRIKCEDYILDDYPLFNFPATLIKETTQEWYDSKGFLYRKTYYDNKLGYFVVIEYYPKTELIESISYGLDSTAYFYRDGRYKGYRKDYENKVVKFEVEYFD
ncbi:MAG: hypothetical protein K9J13_10915 [Saprospiraceae bacterium]|nr:hypothetical protein [Saprospiraceae bacterium]